MGKILRIATLGDYVDYYSHFLYGTMEGAIRCGAWFRPIALFGTSLDKIKEQVDFFKPNILLCHCIFNRHPHNREEVLGMLKMLRKKYGTKVFYHAGDARTQPRYPQDISDFVDVCLVNHLELKQLEEIWKVKCYNWPYACLHQYRISDVDPDMVQDLVFTGSLSDVNHHAPRAAFIKHLSQKVKVKVYPDDRIGNSRFFTDVVSASAKAVLGFQMGCDINGYVDVRPFQYIGAGALYIQDKHNNMDYFFQEGQHYAGFERDNIESFCEVYQRYVVDYPYEGEAIRKQGFKYAQSVHSTKVRMEKVIQIYQNGGKP